MTWGNHRPPLICGALNPSMLFRFLCAKMESNHRPQVLARILTLNYLRFSCDRRTRTSDFPVKTQASYPCPISRHILSLCSNFIIRCILSSDKTIFYKDFELLNRTCGSERNRTVHILVANQNRQSLGTCAPILIIEPSGRIELPPLIEISILEIVFTS